MIIFDKVKNLHNYPQYKQIEEFLSKNENVILENGKHIIDDTCFVNVLDCTTKNPDGLFEGHLKYIDLQVMVAGEEYVHVQEKRKCELQKAYDEEKDVAFYTAKTWHNFYFGTGFFAIFDEDDLHRPSISIIEEKIVKKYIFKIKKI